MVLLSHFILVKFCLVAICSIKDGDDIPDIHLQNIVEAASVRHKEAKEINKRINSYKSGRNERVEVLQELLCQLDNFLVY